MTRISGAGHNTYRVMPTPRAEALGQQHPQSESENTRRNGQNARARHNTLHSMKTASADRSGPGPDIELSPFEIHLMNGINAYLSGRSNAKLPAAHGLKEHALLLLGMAMKWAADTLEGPPKLLSPEKVRRDTVCSYQGHTLRSSIVKKLEEISKTDPSMEIAIFSKARMRAFGSQQGSAASIDVRG